jgi:hypothetical protein
MHPTFANHLFFLVIPSGWLDMDLILPFNIGDFGESKTFVEGYRGAWFRSKVRHLICISTCMI